MLVSDRLRPAGRRRILGADPAAHRQGVRAAGVRIIEHDADIAPVGIAAGQSHPGAQRVGQRHAERQQQRPRAIIAEHPVAVLQAKPKQHLRQVMAARRKLVEDLLGRNELFFLDPVHFAAGQDQPCDFAPVHLRGHLARVAVGHDRLRVQRGDHGGRKSVDLLVAHADHVEAAAVGHVDGVVAAQLEHLLLAQRQASRTCRTAGR